MNRTKIQWSDYTWNPTTGCWHNCDFCYARKIATRFNSGGSVQAYNYRFKYHDEPLYEVFEKGLPFPHGFEPTFYHYRLDDPQKVKKSQKVFVGSMSDLFGEWVPDEWISDVFDACKKAPQHKYLFLTKNPSRLVRMFPDKLPSNHWYGQTVTDGDVFGMPMPNSFISFEPLLAEAHFSPFVKFGWAIVGAETGNRKGKVVPKREWVDNIASFCRERNIPVFMKDSLKDLMGDGFTQEWPEGLK